MDELEILLRQLDIELAKLNTCPLCGKRAYRNHSCYKKKKRVYLPKIDRNKINMELIKKIFHS